jgi:AAA15 family ATPase/GTPase
MDSSKGLFVLIAGANASGKTTVIKPRYVEGRVKHYLDPDRLLPVDEDDVLSPKARQFYMLNLPSKFAVICMEDWLASPRVRNEKLFSI